jgi:butyrate kinase
VKQQAGLDAYMFIDLAKQYRDDLSPISVVKSRGEDEEDPLVRDALRILRGESRVFNWLNDTERAQFIEERVKVAGRP